MTAKCTLAMPERPAKGLVLRSRSRNVYPISGRRNNSDISLTYYALLGSLTDDAPELCAPASSDGKVHC